MFISEVYNRLYVSGKLFNWSEVLTLLDRNPELVKINAHIQQKKLNE